MAEARRELRSVMLVLSVVLAIIPLLGIAWVLTSGTLTTVDGLFMCLILLTLSGILMLNALMEARARGLLNFMHRKKAVVPEPAKPAGTPPQPKTAVVAQTQPGGETPQVQKTS
jgi:hypothetical protein